jgi:hypothetical protein
MLQNTVAVKSALKLYARLDNLSVPRFANGRLHLPCIVFPLTEVKRRPDQDGAGRFTYDIKANGLRDLLVTTGDRLPRLSPSIRTLRSFMLVRLWTRDVAELADMEDGIRTKDYFSAPGSSEEVDTESSERALRLIAHLGQPFNALMLVRQRGEVYKRTASDHNIITQIRDVPSLDYMDIRTLEIL